MDLPLQVTWRDIPPSPADEADIRVRDKAAKLELFDDAHQDMYVAIRDAFDAARRQFRAHARLQRGVEGQGREGPPAKQISVRSNGTR